MKRKLIIHIGLPKTGTSTLQEYVFPNITPLRYLGRQDGIYGKDIIPIEKSLGKLIYGHNEFLKNNIFELENSLLQKEIELFGNNDENLPLLLSTEMITSHLFMPFYKFRFGLWTLDPYILFERMKLFENNSNFRLKIIYSEREPKEFIHSYYAQNYHLLYQHKDVSTLKDYIKYGFSKKHNNILSLLYNNRLKNIILSFFQEEQLRIWDYKQLFKDDINKLIQEDFNDKSFNLKYLRTVNKRENKPSIKIGDLTDPWVGKEKPLRTPY